MADANVNYERILTPFSGGSAGTADGMALKIFSGMVLESFAQSTMFYDRSSTFISVKTLENANSAQWPILGIDPTPAYHTAGQFLNALPGGGQANTIKNSSVDIVVDEILAAALDVPYRDLEVLHFDVMGPYATKLGRSISRILDKKIAALAVKAARTAANTGVHYGGFVQYRDDTSATTSGNADPTLAYPTSPQGAYNFRQDVAAIAQALDEKWVPAESRYLFITPYIKTVLRYEASWTGSAVSASPVLPSIYNADLSAQPNDVNNRVLGMLDGFKVVVTTALPSSNLNVSSGLTGDDAVVAYSSGTAGTGGKYQINASGAYSATTATAKSTARPVAVALCGADTGAPAIGMVQTAGLRSYMAPDERRNTNFLKAQIMCGLDVVCPWSAASIEVYRDG